MPYLSALEVCSRQGAIQIHVYLYLYTAHCTLPFTFYIYLLCTCSSIISSLWFLSSIPLLSFPFWQAPQSSPWCWRVSNWLIWLICRAIVNKSFQIRVLMKLPACADSGTNGHWALMEFYSVSPVKWPADRQTVTHANEQCPHPLSSNAADCCQSYDVSVAWLSMISRKFNNSELP